MRFADSIVWKNKSIVWEGCCQEKNCVFAILFLENERETSELKLGGGGGGVCFSMKLKATCEN